TDDLRPESFLSSRSTLAGVFSKVPKLRTSSRTHLWQSQPPACPLKRQFQHKSSIVHLPCLPPSQNDGTCRQASADEKNMRSYGKTHTHRDEEATKSTLKQTGWKSVVCSQ
ncbi:MAG: hypothetical protein ACK5II_00925, partial [Paracoccus sp. (in: a-proteobacteria)]